MKSILSVIYRYIRSKMLRLSGIQVSPNSYYNSKTVFEGTNVIHSNVAISNSFIGLGTYIGPRSLLPNCKIGRFCSIAKDVKIVSATHPSSVFVSTSPMFFSVLKQNGKTYCNKNKFEEHLSIDSYSAIIGNDVWIGENVIIKGGVRIGDGAIIAMGSVVTKDIPPYAIVGGIPAKVIKYRFTEEEIEFLLSIQWWNKSEEWIIKHSDLFENIEKFIAKIKDENSTCNNRSCL